MDQESVISGYKEIEVTADRGLEIWAPSLEELFENAAVGMLELAGVRTEKDSEVTHKIKISAVDLETLLVTFLEEVAFYLEDENTAFTRFQISIDGNDLKALMRGKKVVEIDYEIKAVTFNEIKIKYEENIFRVTVVFDM